MVKFSFSSVWKFQKLCLSVWCHADQCKVKLQAHQYTQTVSLKQLSNSSSSPTTASLSLLLLLFPSVLFSVSSPTPPSFASQSDVHDRKTDWCTMTDNPPTTPTPPAHFKRPHTQTVWHRHENTHTISTHTQTRHDETKGPCTVKLAQRGNTNRQEDSRTYINSHIHTYHVAAGEGWVLVACPVCGLAGASECNSFIKWPTWLAKTNQLPAVCVAFPLSLCVRPPKAHTHEI